jgi:hypothetical protein
MTPVSAHRYLLSTLGNYPDKDVILVEAGYRPVCMKMGSSPGSPQKAFLEAVNETLLGISDRRIKGIFWREPASGCGRDYFDADCNARPVITVFDRYKRN